MLVLENSEKHQSTTACAKEEWEMKKGKEVKEGMEWDDGRVVEG